MTTAAPAAREMKFTPLDETDRDTVPGMFLSAVERFGRPRALMHKEGGAWRDISHRDALERVRAIAAALESWGIAPGDRVALLSENRPEWALVDFAVTGIGAADVPLYPTLPANQIAYILHDSGAKAIFLSSAEQAAKIAEIRATLPGVAHVVAFDDAAAGDGVLRLADVEAEGRRLIADGRASDFRTLADRVERDDLATLIYTSGTTGHPKGVMLTHWNLASNVAACRQQNALPVMPDDVALSFLPLSHIFERMADYWYWDAGIPIAYAESMEKVVENFAEVRPTIAVSVPRLFDKIHTKVTGAPGLKGRIARWAVRVGERVMDGREAGREPSGMLAVRYRVADRLVFSKLRTRLGGRMRLFRSGGAPLSPEVGKFFFAAGVPVYEGYGLTETSPVLTVNLPDAWRLGTVGPAIPGVEIRVDEHGEILARGPNVMKGYWENPEATREVLDPEGWFHTGDVGEIDARGLLRITDRIKNLLVTAGGKNVAPAPIENVAAMSPYVSQVLMIGDRRAFPTLLVVPDYENLAPWAQAHGLDPANRPALARDPRVVALIEAETLGRLNGFARYEMPKKITVLSEEFTVNAGLLTPTLKVRRKAVEEVYRTEIEAMYTGAVGRGD
jgi:long-chain acyl-CoA synthetase